MGTLSLTLPTIGQPNSTEDVDVLNALTAIQNFVNGTNFGTAQIEANAVTTAKIEAQQAWQTIALGNGVTGNLAYYKDSLGIVRVRGDQFTTGGAGIAVNAVLATFPAGYRPGTLQYMPAIFLTDSASNSGAYTVTISTAGVLAMGSANATPAQARTICFSFQFRAEN